MLRKNDKFNVCLYSSKYDRHYKSINIDELVESDEYKYIIEKLRTEEYKSSKYDALKNELPMFLVSAQYEQGQSKSVNNAKIIPLICIDIDLGDNKEWFSKNSIDATKFFIVDNFKSVRNISMSCGGRGIFVIHRLSDDVTKETFIDYFRELKLLYAQYGITIDEQCSNINRQRFVSYDSFVLSNDIYEPYELQGLKENNVVVENRNIYDNTNYMSSNNWKISPEFDINNYTIKSDCDIEGFNAIRRVWLAMTCKKFFGTAGLQLAIDIFKTYPNSKVKDDSIIHLKQAFNGKSGCVKTIANDLYKLGILVENEEHHNVFNLNKDEYIGDVITKIKFNFGFNLLVAGTGYGKTEVWKKLTKMTGPDGLSTNKVLVCEPRNSIIVSKYDDDTTLVYGGIKFPTIVNGLVVSNYDKLIGQRNIEWFNQFDYFVIDESHLLFSEAYRDRSIIPFIDMLYKIKDHVKIIFQTATPTDEDDMFKIDERQIFYINKNIDKKTEIEYVNTFGNNMYNAMAIAEKALDNEEYDKVFIYNGTGSVNMDEAVAKQLDDKYKTLVYHRKSKFKDVMKLFEQKQRLDEYKIIITSTAASVGIDINDECKVLLIIVDNISFEEEMQVSGRFRKCKDMKIINLIGNNRYNTSNWKDIRKKIFDTLDDSIRTNTLYDSVVTNNLMIDGIPIGNVVDNITKLLKYFEVKNKKLRTTYDYKKNKYNEYGWKLIEDIKSDNIFEVLKNIDGYSKDTLFNMKKITGNDNNFKYYDIDADGNNYRIYGDKENGFVLCKKYYDDNYSGVARNYIKNNAEENERMRDKVYDILKEEKWSDTMYESININHPSIEVWVKNIVKCYKYYRPIFDCCDKDYCMKNANVISLIMRFIELSNSDNFDWCEWEIINMCRTIHNKLNDDSIDLSQYAYLLWCLYGSDESKNKLIKLDYSSIFIELYNMFISLDDNLFATVKGQLRDYEYRFIDDKFADDYIFNDNDIDNNKMEIVRRLYKSHYYTDNDIKNIINNSEAISKDIVLDGYDNATKYFNKYFAGKKGKIITVTDKMPESKRIKYGLNIGDTFCSQKELANNIRKSEETIRQWRNKEWII